MAIELGSDPRTRTTTIAGGAVLLLLWGLAASRSDDTPAPPTPDAIVAECRRLYGELNPTFRGLPEQRFEMSHGDELLRVSVSEVDDWISVCRSGPSGVDAAAGTRMSDGPGDQLRLFDSSGSMLTANLLLGHVPAGATAVAATLTSGQVVTGTTDGDVFAVWSPDATVAGARITATGPGGMTATATAP